MALRSDIEKCKLKRFSVSTLYHAKTKNSTCWKYFGDLVLHDDDDNKKKKVLTDIVFCNVCLTSKKDECGENTSFGSANIKSYSKTVSTGNLMRHLRDDHKIRSEDDVNKAKTNIKDFFNVDRISKTTLPSAGCTHGPPKPTIDRWLLTRDLALWMCKSLMPFDSIADEGMIDFFKKYGIIVNSSDMPSRDSVSRTGLDDVYESMLNNVKTQIISDKAFQLAITFDLWTDSYRRLNYITFTLHYLTDAFELKTFTLKTELMEGKKSGEKIKEAIDETKKEFAITDKNLCSVTDAGANVKRGAALAKIDSHLCLGHGLHNLVTIDGIKKTPEILSLVTKCKKIVKAVRYRLPELEKEAAAEQKEFLNSLEIVAHTIEEDENDPISEYEEEETVDRSLFGNLENIPSVKTSTPTRWHSVLEMLGSMAHCCNRNPINKILRRIGQDDLTIVQSEWNLLEDLVKFLGKFREVVEVLSSQKKCTINLALVFKTELKDVLNSITDDETLIMLSLKNNMLANINKRFPTTKTTVCAALLDCRFMRLKEIDEYLEAEGKTPVSFLTECANEIKAFARGKDGLEANALGSLSPSPSTSKESLLTQLSRKHSFAYHESESADYIEQEVWKYIATADPTELGDGDLLAYWKKKKTTHPYLASLAQAVLCIPATSTPSERVFSVAGLVITAKRSRLSPNRLNKIIFVHDNYNSCKEYITE